MWSHITALLQTEPRQIIMDIRAITIQIPDRFQLEIQIHTIHGNGTTGVTGNNGIITNQP